MLILQTMGNLVSSIPSAKTSTPPPIHFSTELNSYKAECKLVEDLQSFDMNLEPAN